MIPDKYRPVWRPLAEKPGWFSLNVAPLEVMVGPREWLIRQTPWLGFGQELSIYTTNTALAAARSALLSSLRIIERAMEDPHFPGYRECTEAGRKHPWVNIVEDTDVQ